MNQQKKVRDIAIGYGSKWHLLRYLGWHRQRFNVAVRGCIPDADHLDWLDHRFTGKAGADDEQDTEWQGLDFLNPCPLAWMDFWPQTGRPPTWDAVGIATVPNGVEWVLLEAKAHIEELASSTKAGEASKVVIKQALENTQQAMGVDTSKNWLEGYYQYANRLAVLHFLRQEGIPAHLLFVYFVGDRPGKGSNWPQTEQEWGTALKDMDDDLGIPLDHPYQGFIHKLFLPVGGPTKSDP